MFFMKSDNQQLINYKEYFSFIAKRTRSQRKVFNDKINGGAGISSTCRQNGEAAPANRDSASIPRKKVQSRRRGSSSSSRYNSNNVEIEDLEEVPARRKRGRPKGSGLKKKVTKIEDIEEADFLRKKKRRTTLNTKHSERGESSGVKKHAEHAFDQDPVQKGNINEDSFSEEIDLDKLVDEVFINLTTAACYSAVPPRKSSADHHERSSSSLHRESNEEDMVPGGIEIDEIDESEFKKPSRRSKSKIGRPKEQGFESNPSANTGNQDELGGCRKSKFGDINRDEFTSGKSRTSSRMGSSARQGYRENAVEAELPAENKSRSFTEKGNNIEDIDPDELMIIDESDFKKSVRENKSSMRKDESRNKNLHNDDNDSSDEHMSSEPSSKSSSENNSTSLPNYEISSEHETSLGVADQTRSKKSSIEPEEVSSFSLSLSLDSLGSEELSTNDKAQNNIPMEVSEVSVRKDEDFRQEGSVEKHAPNRRCQNPQNKEPICEQRTSQKLKFPSTKRQLSSEACTRQEKGRKAHKACDVHEERNRSSGAVSKAEEELNERKSALPKSACPEKSYAQNNCDEANKGCEQRTFQKQKFPSRKRQLSSEASTKQEKGRKAQKTCDVHEERNRSSGADSKGEDELNERSALPKSSCPERSYAQNNCDEENKGNGLHSKDQSQAEIMMQKKEAPFSHPIDDHNYIDDDGDDDDNEDEEDCNGDIPEETEATDEIKEPTRNQQVSSNQNDIVDTIADAILGNRARFETKGNDEETVLQALPFQTESTLPRKFTFEDEVPKEVEKTEQEKEMEGLFSDLDSLWYFGNLEASIYDEVQQEDEIPPAEETHFDRCNRGKHDLYVIEDEGMICRYCQFVALGPKDIMPDWAQNTPQRGKRCREAEEPEFDELDFEHGKDLNNGADCGNFGDGTVWSLKAGIWDSMYEHQREGFEFLWKNLAGSIQLEELKSSVPHEVGGCIISHAPGTGKTRLTINFIETYMRLFPASMPVIIAPASMLLTWEDEFKKWNVGFSFLNLNNPENVSPKMQTSLKKLQGVNHRNQDASRMLKIWHWTQGRSVLGISYNLYEKLTGEEYLKVKGKRSKGKGKKPLDAKYKKMGTILLEKPGVVFLDEGHTPRNQRSNIWNALLKLKTDKRVILSGTPFQNNFGELFNTLHLVRPSVADVLTKEKAFAEMFATGGAAKTNYNDSRTFVDKLKLIMAPFVHVHKGTILQQNLPGLRDCVVLLKPSTLQKSLIDRLDGSGNFVFEYRVALISVHPYLLENCDFPEEQLIGIDRTAIKASKMNPNEGVKIKFILELVRLSLALNEKLLIFSQYIKPLDLIQEYLKECFNWANGKEVLRLGGKMDQKQRQVLINAFNDPKNVSKIMLGSTRCCSEGISLIGASRVVLLDVVWNPSVERQAISRAYRIGQKKFVYTYHLMVSGTTEANKYCTQTDKERLSELVFTSSSNEIKTQKQPALGIEDRVLEQMVGQERLKAMFDMIINQPKETDLIRTFGLT